MKDANEVLDSQKLLKSNKLGRGYDSKAEKQIGNFIFCFGCQPGFGVAADTMYCKNLIDLFNKNWDTEKHTISIPDIFQKVVSTDAVFETVSCSLSRKLMLMRQDIRVGHKTLIYAYDSTQTHMETTRKFVFDFFKQTLGFTDDEIFICDKAQFQMNKFERDKFAFTLNSETRENFYKISNKLLTDDSHGLAR